MGTESKADLRLIAQVINASCAGLIGIGCVYPLNLVKYTIQNQPIIPGKEVFYKNIFDCARKIVHRQGFRGMYNGLTINALFITPEKTIKLVVNDYLRRVLKKENEPLSLLRQISAGAGAGTCQIIVTVPMELLVIRKVTATGEGDVKVQITSAREHIAKVYRERGLIGLYRGSSATWSRDVFFSMIYFPLYAYLNEFGRLPDQETIPYYHRFLAGIAASSVAGYLATPFDVVKTRIQAAKGTNLYSGVIDCTKKIIEKEPLRVFMKGSLLRVTVIAPLFGILQLVFEIGIGENLLGIKNK